MSQQQDSDSISTEGNVVQGTPPKQDSKDRLWGAIAEFHARKKQRMIELKLEEEQEEQRRFEEAIQRAKEASSIRISRTEAGGEETQVAGSSRAAASLATMFAARLAVLGTQPNSKKVKQSASKKTWVKTRASARIAASRRANASATSGVKQKKPEIERGVSQPIQWNKNLKRNHSSWKNWKNLSSQNQLQKGMKLNIWSFRINDKLYFTVE